LVTYRSPLAPKTIDVGVVRPATIVVFVPLTTRTMLPVPGDGPAVEPSVVCST
jgi:hypothetical protein